MKKELNIHQLGETRVALEMVGFQGVRKAAGFRLAPQDDRGLRWRFHQRETGLRGILLHVGAFFEENYCEISLSSVLYLVEQQHYLWALLFPHYPLRLRVKDSFKPLHSVPEKLSLNRQCVQRFIRVRFQTVAVLDQAFLLEHLRKKT